MFGINIPQHLTNFNSTILSFLSLLFQTATSFLLSGAETIFPTGHRNHLPYGTPKPSSLRDAETIFPTRRRNHLHAQRFHRISQRRLSRLQTVQRQKLWSGKPTPTATSFADTYNQKIPVRAMALVAGSYDHYVWGFSLKNLSSSPSPKTLITLFSYPSHTAAIKSVAAAGSIAASGGSDDTIKVYDLSASTEIGSLTDHSGAVTSLAFYTCPLATSFPRNLISAGDDGNLCIFDTDPFVNLKTIHVHRRGVADLAVHPSGRLALTVGRDSCLAMINLIRGRRSFSCHLDREASIIKYGSEEWFFMVAEERITMHNAEDAKIVQEMVGQKRALSIATSKDGLLFTGGEDKNVVAWDTTSGKVAYSIDGAHSARVKGLVIFEALNCLASASSDGVIRIWDLRRTSKEKGNPLTELNTRSRLTCLAGSSI